MEVALFSWLHAAKSTRVEIELHLTALPHWLAAARPALHPMTQRLLRRKRPSSVCGLSCTAVTFAPSWHPALRRCERARENHAYTNQAQ